MPAQERPGARVADPAARPAPLGWLRAGLTDREALRNWTLVANDGIIATAGILEGVRGGWGQQQHARHRGHHRDHRGHAHRRWR